MKPTKAESIKEAILKAIDKKDTKSAMELVNHWEANFPLEQEGRSLFLYTKDQALISCMEAAKDQNEKMKYLSKAIETCNQFFAANESEGFPMDSEAEKMWFRMIDLSAEQIAYYSEGAYDDEEDYEESDEDFEDEDYEEDGIDILSAAIHDGIGRINRPNLKPKPPRKYDGSLKSRLLKAVDLHIEKYGDLDSSNMNLITNICEELNIDPDDFLNSIYNY